MYGTPTMKNSYGRGIIGTVALFLTILAIAPVANAQSYNQPSGFFWPYGTGMGAPREVLTVHSWGPTEPPAYHSMSGAPSPWQTIYPQQTYPTYPTQPQQYAMPGYNQPYYQPTYNQPQYMPQVQPQYIPQNSFVPQQYQYYTPQINYGYQYPQTNYGGLPAQAGGYGYQQPTYYGGGYGGYGTPDGGTDIWGNPSCNWGDYQGYSCGTDPHQWIYDPYSGEYY